jgi:hypothetical protein|tara:strand:- start:5050 stop:5238 length:189 start_codon:yes stop_codon:yes gene_type:complete
MKKTNPLVFKNKINLELLPKETLLGLKMINCEILCEDDKYRPVYGIEIGLIFFTFSYVNMRK